MKKLFVTIVLVAAFAAAPQAMSAEAGMENCYVVRAEADGRNQDVATERAIRRLRRHIADDMRNMAGKTIGKTSTYCIRNSCKASAIVCQH
jgi:Ni/Co efflux regulator RcnB